MILTCFLRFLERTFLDNALKILNGVMDFSQENILKIIEHLSYSSVIAKYHFLYTQGSVAFQMPGLCLTDRTNRTYPSFLSFRPAQHGTDVIGLISKILDDFERQSLGKQNEVAESAVYLALEALRSLCEFEVGFNLIQSVFANLPAAISC